MRTADGVPGRRRRRHRAYSPVGAPSVSPVCGRATARTQLGGPPPRAERRPDRRPRVTVAPGEGRQTASCERVAGEGGKPTRRYVGRPPFTSGEPAAGVRPVSEDVRERRRTALPTGTERGRRLAPTSGPLEGDGHPSRRRSAEGSQPGRARAYAEPVDRPDLRTPNVLPGPRRRLSEQSPPWTGPRNNPAVGVESGEVGRPPVSGPTPLRRGHSGAVVQGCW